MPHFGEFERTLINPLRFEEDAGADQELIDMSVSAAPAAGAEMSYHLRIDDMDFIELYAEADGAGGLQNEKVTIPQALEILGDIYTIAGNLRFFRGTTKKMVIAPAAVYYHDDLNMKDGLELQLGTDSDATLEWDDTNSRVLLAGANFVDETADGMTANPEAAAEDGFLKIRIGTTNYQIPLYAA